ncbi:site-specific DNA-methyltransferase [Kocuria rhizophila]|uniref:site-specific DNA-methyltransferase n=1 Tax=Kocuria rhizophila TaxID=72000 RepID=UPI00073DA780|nr:site-specific DNA-methyltransferase [Kocuria rhizophila]
MNDSRTRIEVLLSRVEDAGVREQLRRAIGDATEHRPLGLVFEEHMPEAIRIPEARVRRGSTVQFRDERDSHVWDVRRVRDGKASLSRRDADGSIVKDEDVDVTDLVVARRLGDPVYPGLTPLGTIDRGGDKPHHIVIEGENFHALQALEYTHKGEVDLIYIDPPYNTGSGDWIYNDRYVGDADSYRHSKWLSFMHRRLTLARTLLSKTGVIIVAIGDDEHHRLRMLMDQVFGERNFIANVVWQGGGSSLSRFHGGGIDYMLIYSRELQALTEADVRWKVEKDGLQDVLDAAADAWEKSGHDSADASKRLSAWWNRNKVKYDPGLGDNVKVDDKGEAVKVGDLGNSVFRPNLKYPITDPKTGISYDPPPNGWRFRRDVMDERIKNDGVLFGARPRLKTPLREMSMRSVMPSFYKDRRAASQHLSKILGSKDFPYPKDVDIIARWIGIATSQNPDAVVLDFFAGTGTTAEAVMRLNAVDGGRRQSILVTNNELSEKTAKKLAKAGVERGSAEWEAEGVFEKVTRPRIETVVTGSRPDGSEFSTGLDENVSFFKLEYLDRDSVEAGAAFTRVAELLWAKAGGIGPVITERSGTHAATDHYAVCFDADRFAAFVDEVNTRETIRVAYVVASSEVTFGTVKRALREDVVSVHLYENYLSNFEINTGVAR